MREPAGPSTDVVDVARALHARGAVRESIAMLRGALAREPDQSRCRELLERVVTGDPLEPLDAPVDEDFALVDRWIRSGMLVEALALLGGSPMGGEEIGREWANLLGEILAPVPVDTEEVLREVYRSLLRGAAPVALTLLEERARGGDPMPAWAQRRLEVLRWLLLDNAAAAEDAPALPDEVPSLLAGAIREPLHRRNLGDATRAAAAFSAEHPASRDAARTATALAALLDEVERQVEQASTSTRTMPIFGRPAAALQLRMANFPHAASVYARVLEQRPDDEACRRLAEHVEVVERALAGEPVIDEWGDDSTTNIETIERAIPERSGPVSVGDLGPTEEMPDLDGHLAMLRATGRGDEADRIERAADGLFGPGEAAHGDVVIHVIRSVK